MSDVVNFLQRIVMNMQLKSGLTQKPSIYFQLVLLLPCPQPRNHSRRPKSFPYESTCSSETQNFQCVSPRDLDNSGDLDDLG
jgi:hypothetical protein